MHYHKRLNKWLQPGGHLDEGETPLDAARRETFEETGVAALFEDEIFHLDVHEAYDHVHYDIRYIGVARNVYLRPPENESQKVSWFSPSALASIDDIAISGGIKKLLKSHFA